MKNLFGSKKHADLYNPGLRLDGKVAVITGAASGIGAATARLFVTHGAKVIIADIQAEEGKKISSELGSYAHYIHCDVAKESDVAAAVDYALSSWGRLDIMFNNAGIAGPLSDFANLNVDEIDGLMAVNIKGAVLGVKHAARVMVPAGKGVILFSGSTSADMGGTGAPLYSASKAAILSIVRSAAAELGRHGIRVNAVSPHTVATPMSIAAFSNSICMSPKVDLTVNQFEKVLAAGSELMGQVLTVDQVASAVLFLASEEAGYVSGHNLVLDGGFTVTKEYNSLSLKAAMQKSVAAERKAEAESKKKEGTALPPKAGSTKKEREKEDKAREKEERAREAEEKAAHKKAEEKEKEKNRDEVEREKRERDRLMESKKEEMEKEKQEKLKEKEKKLEEIQKQKQEQEREKERELEEIKKEKQEKAREKERKKEEREKEKREKERLRKEERARAKEEKLQKNLQRKNKASEPGSNNVISANDLTWGVDPTSKTKNS